VRLRTTSMNLFPNGGRASGAFCRAFAMGSAGNCAGQGGRVPVSGTWIMCNGFVRGREEPCQRGPIQSADDLPIYAYHLWQLFRYEQYYYGTEGNNLDKVLPHGTLRVLHATKAPRSPRLNHRRGARAAK
jgi:hypothetical protein